jgi:hypothetical protein
MGKRNKLMVAMSTI